MFSTARPCLRSTTMYAMTAPLCQSGSKKSEMNEAENDCMVHSQEDSVLGTLVHISLSNPTLTNFHQS